MASSVPLIDLSPWFAGNSGDRAKVTRCIDESLRESGFLLVSGHGVPDELRRHVRMLARRFFALPESIKGGYAATVGGRGWLPLGVEANGYAEGTETPPDLKESYSIGADEGIGDREIDAMWFRANIWPAQVPELQVAVEAYMTEMRSLSTTLLTIFAMALGLPSNYFTVHARHPTYTFNLNWYPPRSRVGCPQDGQFRIGPHTDFGTVTILDREAGAGGLQVYTSGGCWEDAPLEPGAFTVNTGDLMARWTGDRWRSTRHRVLPPPSDQPDEELVSLIWFYELDPKARICSMAPPIGHTSYPEIVAHEYLMDKVNAITVF